MHVTSVCGLSRPERPSSADSVMAPASQQHQQQQQQQQLKSQGDALTSSTRQCNTHAWLCPETKYTAACSMLQGFQGAYITAMTCHGSTLLEAPADAVLSPLAARRCCRCNIGFTKQKHRYSQCSSVGRTCDPTAHWRAPQRLAAATARVAAQHCTVCLQVATSQHHSSVEKSADLEGKPNVPNIRRW
jgi:hypothetical protein